MPDGPHMLSDGMVAIDGSNYRVNTFGFVSTSSISHVLYNDK
jgi:hypothetical protein